MARLLFGSFLLLAAAWVITVNWILFYRGWIRRQKTSSIIPFVGGVLGVLGMITMPQTGLHWFAWLPLILDWGSVPAVIAAVVMQRRHT